MRIADMTVFEYGRRFARDSGLTFMVTETGRDYGVIEVDPVRGVVTVHHRSDQVTLEMNTRGPLLPGAYDKTT